MTGFRDTERGPLTIQTAGDLMRVQALTPVSLLEHCLAMIDVYEPMVQAWTFLDRDRAKVDAERLTAELDAGFDRGPLHGIPIGVKDIVDVYDMPTGCGSADWRYSYARRDADCVDRLRHAGAIILGKTVTTAYAYLDPPRTRNPWALDRTPGGSSSGSAAAVACGMCLGAIASQTGGSTIRPAAYCGIAAIKPTFGRIATDGALPLAPSLDHIGLMAADVRGLVPLLQATAEQRLGETPPPDDYGRKFPPDAPPRTLGIPAGISDKLAYEDWQQFQQAVLTLETEGWTIRPTPMPGDFVDYWRNYAVVIAVEAATVHAERLARRADEYAPQIRNLVETGQRISGVEYQRASEHLARVRDGGRLGLFAPPFAALLCPSATGPAPLADSTGDPKMNSPWSYAGLPAVSVLSGWSEDGLPLGVQLIGLPWQESELLGTAADVEKCLATVRRPAPVPV